MGDRLPTVDMGQKLERGDYAPFWGSGPRLTECPWAEAYLRTK